jgi:hypothetical protein
VSAIPEPLLSFLLVAGLLGLVVGLVSLGRELVSRWQANNEISKVMRQVLDSAITDVYETSQDIIGTVTSAEAESNVVKLARLAYAALPECIGVPIGKRVVVIPFKVFISEVIFCNTCLTAYRLGTVCLAELDRMADDAYAEWKGTQLTVSGGTVKVWLP